MEAEDLLLKCHSIFIIPQEQNYYIHSGLSWWVGASHIIIVISPLIWCVSASQTSSMVTQATVTWYTPGLPNEKKVYANATRCERSEYIFKSSQLFLQKLSIWKNNLFFSPFVTVTEETNPLQNIYAVKCLERLINMNQTSKTEQYLINLDYVGNLFRLNSWDETVSAYWLANCVS